MPPSFKIMITCFCIDPCGPLHINHIKPMVLSFKSKNHVRFNDTNPKTSTQEYVNSIQEDMIWLGFVPIKITYISDYFHRLYDYAVELIKKGYAYVDLSTVEDIKNSRIKEIPSFYRDAEIPWNLEHFDLMKTGHYKEGQAVLRLKINSLSGHKKFMDPIAYRIKLTPHYRTGITWCIYPTYDYSQGIIDVIEGITHVFYSTKNIHRRYLYNWCIDTLGKTRNDIIDDYDQGFKAPLIEKYYTLEWDPVIKNVAGPMTIQCLKNRGYTPLVLRDIISSLSIIRRDTVISLEYMERMLKDNLNSTAYRAFGIINPMVIELTDIMNLVTLSHPHHPRFTHMGQHSMTLSRDILIEEDDFQLFLNSSNSSSSIDPLDSSKIVRLRYGPLIQYMDDRDENSIKCRTIDPSPDMVKSNTIHWISVKDAIPCIFEFYDFIHKTPDKMIRNGYVESFVLSIDRVYQFERWGYFKLSHYNINNIPVFIWIVRL